MSAEATTTTTARPAPPADPPAADPRRPRRRPRPPGSRAVAVVRWTFLGLLAVYFVVPQLAMARFAFQNVPVVLLGPDDLLRGWSLRPLLDAVSEPALWESARTSVLLALATVLLTLALLLPLAVIAEVRSPWLRPVLSAVTLLPWVVPPIAIVVGVAATFRPLAPWFLSSTFALVPFYAVWAMPFTYRALDAGLRSIGARTLVEAAQSLGASTPRVLLRVLLPSLVPSLVAAGGLTTALVLGEFAFASLLLKDTLPTYLVVYQKQEAQAGMALALTVLLLTALLLGAVVRLLRRRGLGVSTTGL